MLSLSTETAINHFAANWHIYWNISVVRISNWTSCTSYKVREFAVVDAMICIWSSRDFFSILAVAMKVIRRRNWAKLNVKQQQKIWFCPRRHTLCALSCRKQATEERGETRLWSRHHPIVCICLLVLPHTYILCPYSSTRNPFPTCLTLLRTRLSGFMHST